jgi:type II secretory pathway component PulJ
MMRPSARAGSALLDVVVALTLLGSSGIALIALVGQTARTMRHVAFTERETRLAARELDRFVLYDRAQLVAMVGRRELRDWSIDVEQVDSDLFDVAIAPSDTVPSLLRTTVYRPDSIDAPAP